MPTTSLSPTIVDVSTDLAPGAAVGEYILEAKLGRGGMGAVYRAVHPVIGKRVAVKVLHPDLCENDDALVRFVHEARAVNTIGHPGIVDVFGFGTTADGRAFLAMELLSGESLARRLERTPALTLGESCRILGEVTDALEAAHAAGIIHRDLKPDNVFLVAERNDRVGVRLLDFGIAKLTGGGALLEGPVNATQPGQLIGTPQYMAPEQARGLPLQASADVYALGVMAFEMFAGRPPFVSDDPVELIAKHITLAPPEPSDFNAELPELADVLVGEMLAKDPSRRPVAQRVRELLQQLAAAPDANVVSRRAGRKQDATVLEAEAEPARRRRTWIIPAALAGCALAVASVVLVVRGGRSSDREAVPQIPIPIAIPAPTPAAPPPPAPIAAEPPATVTPPTRHVPAKATTTRPPKKVVHHVDEPHPASTHPAPPAPQHHEDDEGLRSPFDSP